jgi:hypothetical protein
VTGSLFGPARRVPAPTIRAVPDSTTTRRAYFDALADLDRTTAALDAAGIFSEPLQVNSAPVLTSDKRDAVNAYRAAWERYLMARREFYGS